MAVDWSWCCLCCKSRRRRVLTAQRRLAWVLAEPSWWSQRRQWVPAAVFGAIGVGGLTRYNSRRRLSKIVEWLKQAEEAREGARGAFKGGAFARRLKFQKQTGLSYRSGWICTQKFEKEALRNDLTIETNQGGRRTAISRIDHMTGASKIQKTV